MENEIPSDDPMILARQLFNMIVAYHEDAGHRATPIGSYSRADDQIHDDFAAGSRTEVPGGDLIMHKHGSPRMNTSTSVMKMTDTLMDQDPSFMMHAPGALLTRDVPLIGHSHSKSTKVMESKTDWSACGDGEDVVDELKDSIHLSRKRLNRRDRNASKESFHKEHDRDPFL